MNCRQFFWLFHHKVLVLQERHFTIISFPIAIVFVISSAEYLCCSIDGSNFLPYQDISHVYSIFVSILLWWIFFKFFKSYLGFSLTGTTYLTLRKLKKGSWLNRKRNESFKPFSQSTPRSWYLKTGIHNWSYEFCCCFWWNVRKQAKRHFSYLHLL